MSKSTQLVEKKKEDDASGHECPECGSVGAPHNHEASHAPNHAAPNLHGDPIWVFRERIARLDPHAETSHTEYGISYLSEGWFEMEHGSRIRSEAGSVMIVPAGVPHRPLRGRDMEFRLVGFCPGCIELDESHLLMLPFQQIRAGALPIVQLTKTRGKKLQRLMDELKQECERRGPESAVLCRSLLFLILGEVYRAFLSTKKETFVESQSQSNAALGSSSDSIVTKTLNYIQAHALEVLSLRDVAAAVGKSSAHLTSVVKRETGYSVGQWIQSTKVAEVASRLAHTDESIDEIASRVGWKDSTHCIRQFKKAYGKTPAAWRKEKRGG